MVRALYAPPARLVGETRLCWYRDYDGQGITTEVTGEGSSIALVNDRMLKGAELSYEHFGVTADWRTLAEYFGRVETRSTPTINIATFVPKVSTFLPRCGISRPPTRRTG